MSTVARFENGRFTLFKQAGMRKKRWTVYVFAETAGGSQADTTLSCKNPIRFRQLNKQLIPDAIHEIIDDLGKLVPGDEITHYGFTVTH